MKKLMTTLIALFTAGFLWAGGVPGQITYQGTIKQQGVPVNGSLTMTFRISNADGTQGYWSSGDQIVTVNQGLFATVLAPTGINWENVTPYIEVSVGGQVLLPRSPITANAYSLTSGSVIDGAITSSKLAPQAVTSAAMSAGAVTTASIASQAVGTDQLADGSVTTAKLAAGAIPSSVPTGALFPFGGTTAPTGYLFCDGSAVSRTTYSGLFTAIGTLWGAGDGIATFNLPDLRGRTPIGAGQGLSLSLRTIGQFLGEETHTLIIAEMPSHNHSITDPGHSHHPSSGSNFITNLGSNHFGNGPQSLDVSGATTAPAYTGISINSTGGDQAHNVMQPSIVVNYIIKT